MNNSQKTRAKTTQTSLEIIDALRKLNGADLEALSDELGVATSTVHRHLVTLQESGYVIREGNIYRIGLMFLTVGGYAQRHWEAYSEIKTTVDELAADTGERTQFIVNENGERVYLYTEVGQSAVETGAQNGKRGYLHCSAAGKAILATLSDDRIRAIIDRRGLPKVGPHTVTSRSELFERLATIRERGYAFNREETTQGVHAVGASVTNGDGEVIGGLSVSGPARRLTGTVLTEELPGQVLSAVNELELQIQHSV